MLKPILRVALKEIEAGRPAVLVSILAAHGSTPRGAGAAMLVGAAGVLAGTIGGGALEHRAAEMALSSPSPRASFRLDNGEAAALGMVCGGSAELLFTPLSEAALLRETLARLEAPRPGWLLLPLDGGAPACVAAGALPARAAGVEWEGRACLSLPLMAEGRVFLFGGGHVALALAEVLQLLAYPHVVVDDRAEFSGAARFPHAIQALTSPFTALDTTLTDALAPGERDAICIMTRGHLADADGLRFALSTPAGYIGLMGSRSKRERVFRTLSEEGFSRVEERVRTPIGLPIGGETPAEIAVAIAAELIAYRNAE